jgi:hypothetical protein
MFEKRFQTPALFLRDLRYKIPQITAEWNAIMHTREKKSVFREFSGKKVTQDTAGEP